MRIASANCASIWQQTFGFDPFGNISKSGSGSFLPTYNTSTNRFSTIPGGTPTYDNNGNLTNDLSHTYSWDADGKALAVDTVSLTYDALGRMVEQARGSTYTQIVYSPLGSKLALMSGQTLQRAFVALPTGATAVYTSAGLAYYRHADWLGSSRLATTPSRAKYYDVAYGPYGESYSGSGTTDLNFTGQNQDTASGLYDFLYREYHSAQGRWISPDPAGSSAVNMGNPQTWNRYAYTGNNPLSLVDSFGLEPTEGCPPSIADCGGGGGFGYGGDPNTPGADSSDPLTTGNPLADPNYWASYQSQCTWGSDCSFWGNIHDFFGEVDVWNGERWVLYAAAPSEGQYVVPSAMRARNAVIGILSSDNSCSAWLNSAAALFGDMVNGDDQISTDSYFEAQDVRLAKAPGTVGAQTQQGAGMSATIFINPNGPFFNAFSSAMGNKVMQVGPFNGGTLSAQISILLHEFSHTLNAIPSDHNNVTQSVENTNTVIRHCRRQISAAR